MLDIIYLWGTLVLCELYHYTFGVDGPGDNFPVFVKALNRESLVLYEIETVAVPINDLNDTAYNYSKVTISKQYMAINDVYCIQLCIHKLHMGKHINYEYFCEELFLVQHKYKHSYESATFFDIPKSVIE